MKPNEILSARLIDVIFDGRNKAYGAYELRKTYSQRIKKALLLTSLIAGLAVGGAVLASSLDKKESNYRVGPEMRLSDIPDEKVPEKLPEPIKKPDPLPVKTEIYTEPVIVDKEVLDKPPPSIEDLEGAKIDLFKQEGEEKDNIVGPGNIDGEKGIIQAKPEKESEPFTSVEIDAKFNGNWKAFLERNLNAEVPRENNAPPGRYSVVMQFVVDTDGSVSNIKALTDHGYGLEQEAIRVLKKAAKWEPAIQNGIQVKAYKRQVIIFEVLEEE